jgi:hypothetical protein
LASEERLETRAALMARRAGSESLFWRLTNEPTALATEKKLSHHDGHGRWTHPREHDIESMLQTTSYIKGGLHQAYRRSVGLGM